MHASQANRGSQIIHDRTRFDRKKEMDVGTVTKAQLERFNPWLGPSGTLKDRPAVISPEPKVFSRTIKCFNPLARRNRSRGEDQPAQDNRQTQPAADDRPVG
jgi:hypothetical protein